MIYKNKKLFISIFFLSVTIVIVNAARENRLESGEVDSKDPVRNPPRDPYYEVKPHSKEFSYEPLRKEIGVLYREHLGREPDQNGMNFWLQAVEMNKLPLEKVSFYMKTSNEAKIRQYYLTHFKREPDQSGPEGWISDDERTESELEKIRNQMRKSPQCVFDCLK